MTRPARAQRRAQARALVEQRDLKGLREWAAQTRSPLPWVVALVFEVDDRLRWRAIEALGELCAVQGDLEPVRGIIRRLLWLMNDESGGIAWHGPEAIGEILARRPVLVGEYGQILASFLTEPPFGPGVAWALARAAPRAPARLAEATDDLRAQLGQGDPFGRAHALRALACLAPDEARRQAQQLLADEGTYWDYDRADGELRQRRVAEVARSIVQGTEAAA